MIINFIVFNSTSGEILRTGLCPSSMAAMQAQTGETVIYGTASDITQYIDVATQSVIDKVQLPAIPDKTTVTADGIDQIVVSGLPNPTNVDISGPIPVSAITVIDGTLEFTTDVIGLYEITLSASPFLDNKITVTAQ